MASPGEGFAVRGPLESAASDGSGYFSVGQTVIMLPPESPLLPSTRALTGVEVELILQRRLPR